MLIFAVARFALGANGVPYAPRGNAMFSIVGLTFVSSVYFGALSRRLGGFGWGGTALVGYSIGLWAQLLIFVATWLSFAMGIESSYFRHWDALNVPEGTVVTMAAALTARAGGVRDRPPHRDRSCADRPRAERARSRAGPLVASTAAFARRRALPGPSPVRPLGEVAQPEVRLVNGLTTRTPP